MKVGKAMRKRWLSAAMVLVLCVGMVQPAFAASFGELQDAIDSGTSLEQEGAAEDATGAEKYRIEVTDGDEGRNVKLYEAVTRGEDEAGTSITISGEDNNITLDLNGQTIDGEEKGGAVITVVEKGSLTITDSTAQYDGDGKQTYAGAGKITGGTGETSYTVVSGQKTTNGSSGGGIVVKMGGSVTMEAGEISDNSATRGGGVYIYAGDFNMTGGKITGNTVTRKPDVPGGGGQGGGVYVGGGEASGKGSFTISGGEISENTSNDAAAGVVVDRNSEFTMTGGKITGNTTKNGGGGVQNHGTSTMTGGEITGNTAGTYGGGVANWGSGSFTMTDGVIANNTAKELGDDIFSNPGAQLTLSKAKDMGATLEEDSRPITNWCWDDQDGWGNGTYAYYCYPTIDGNSGWYLKAAHNQYFTVTYTGEGLEEKSIDVEKGSYLPPDVVPTRDGCYDFSGWALEDGSDPSKVQVTGDMKLVAQWTAAEHTWDDGAETKAPTCTEAGERTYTCTACGETRTEEIEATGHDEGAWATTVEPGPGTPGEEARTCTKCGEVLETREIAALPVVPDDPTPDDPTPDDPTPDDPTPDDPTPDDPTPDDPTPDDPTPDDPADDGSTGDEPAVVEIDEGDVPLAGLPAVLQLEPEEKLTRGQLVAILHWMDSEPAAALASFLDVAADSGYAEAIGWAQANDIAVGNEDNNFFPEDFVTRGQLVDFLNRYAKYVGSEAVLELEGDPDEFLTWAMAEAIINDFFARLYA